MEIFVEAGPSALNQQINSEHSLTEPYHINNVRSLLAEYIAEAAYWIDSLQNVGERVVPTLSSLVEATCRIV